MKPIVQLLVLNAVKDVLRYKSFILLIFLLMLVDKFAKKLTPGISSIIEKPDAAKQLEGLASYLYLSFPEQLKTLLSDYRIFLVLLAGFFLKALISLWPSSDMRRMHRSERKGFGIISALVSLRWVQLVWDLVAVVIICLLGCVWLGVHYFIGLIVWQQGAVQIAAVPVLMGAFLYWPISIAGFSYSSKIAVISKGTFIEKLSMFFLLFKSPKIFGYSWLFYSFRIYLEVVVIALVPMLVVMYIDVWFARILVISVIACPVYALLKMISFKVFLHLFKEQKLIQEEYSTYFNLNP